jgi:hypothetical protein
MKMNIVKLISTVIDLAFEAVNRPELCQAMMSFINQLMSQLPDDHCTAADMIHETMQKWILLIQHCSLGEQVPDLRIAAARSLETVGTHILLIDSGPVVGISLSSWNVVLELLQDDDVDVRQATAACVAAVNTCCSQDSAAMMQQIQPSWALQLIPHLLFSIYSTNNPIQLFEWLLTMIWEGRQVQTPSADKFTKSISSGQESSRELFVKGDINPYAEATTKLDVAAETLRLLLQSDNIVSKDDHIFVKYDHLLSQCLESIVQLTEAEYDKALFQSQWESRGHFVEIYAIILAAHALCTVGQSNPVRKSKRQYVQDLLEKNRLPLGQPKLCKAIQLLYSSL